MKHESGTLGWFRELTAQLPDDTELVTPGHQFSVELGSRRQIGTLSVPRVIFGSELMIDDPRIRMISHAGLYRVVCPQAKRAGLAHWSKVYTNGHDLIIEKKTHDSLGETHWQEIGRIHADGSEFDKVLYCLLSSGAHLK